MEKVFKNISKTIVRAAMYIFFRIVYKAEVKGLENIPKNEALLFCGNHRNYVDPPLMVATAKTDLRFIGKEELGKNKFFGFLKYIFDGIYVKRDSKDISAIKEVLRGLKNGDRIAMFPEGTRNAAEKGEKAKSGAIFFALKAGVRIIPVGIKGGMKKWDKVTINYGKPLDFSKYKDSKEKDNLEKATEELMNEIFELAK